MGWQILLGGGLLAALLVRDQQGQHGRGHAHRGAVGAARERDWHAGAQYQPRAA